VGVGLTQSSYTETVSLVVTKFVQSELNKLNKIVLTSMNRKLVDDFVVAFKAAKDNTFSQEERIVTTAGPSKIVHNQPQEIETMTSSTNMNQIEPVIVTSIPQREEKPVSGPIGEVNNLEGNSLKEDKQAEDLQIAEEKQLVNEAKLAEEKRLAEEAKLAEEKRLAEEAKLAEEKRLAEEAKLAEEKRLAEEAKLAEEKRLAEEAKLAEEKRLAEEAKLAEEKRLAEEDEEKAHMKRILDEAAESEARRISSLEKGEEPDSTALNEDSNLI
jgi:hypothetical protein